MHKAILILSVLLSINLYARLPSCAPLSIKTVEINNLHDYAFEEIRFAKNIAELPHDHAQIQNLNFYTTFVTMVGDFFDGSIPLAIDIIRNQRTIFATHMGEDRAYTHDLVLNRWSQHIRKASCLDVFLMQRHLSYRREMTAPHIYSEFRAIVLEKRNIIKVYLFSSLRSGGMAPNPDAAIAKIKKDLNLGYKATRDIHNHPFRLRMGLVDNGGSIVPSGCEGPNDCGNTSDMWALKKSYEQWGIKIGNITNGFETIDLPIREFYSLNP